MLDIDNHSSEEIIRFHEPAKSLINRFSAIQGTKLAEFNSSPLCFDPILFLIEGAQLGLSIGHQPFFNDKNVEWEEWKQKIDNIYSKIARHLKIDREVYRNIFNNFYTLQSELDSRPDLSAWGPFQLILLRGGGANRVINFEATLKYLKSYLSPGGFIIFHYQFNANINGLTKTQLEDVVTRNGLMIYRIQALQIKPITGGEFELENSKIYWDDQGTLEVRYMLRKRYS